MPKRVLAIGLLRGKRSSHGWARFWFVLGYLLCAILVVLSLVAPDAASATWFGTEKHGAEAVPQVLAMAVALAATVFLLHRLLVSPKAARFYQE